MRPYPIEEIDDLAVVQVYANGFHSFGQHDRQLTSSR